MAAHIFTVSEENYKICINRGLVAIPDSDQSQTNDALISRMMMIKENDYILLYINGLKEIRGVWQAEGLPFYDNTPVWQNREYPFRCKIKCSNYNYLNPLKLDDINDLRNIGKIWSWALNRNGGNTINSLFSISDSEFNILLLEFAKKNPITNKKGIILEPYPYHSPNLNNCLSYSDNSISYESTVMALLNMGFSKGENRELFGEYSDYLCYVPTTRGKEIDILLMYDNPLVKNEIISYDIIEVKRDKFGLKELKQLIGYESWFLQKKVAGDSNMVRATAIAEKFSKEVIDYVSMREMIEQKSIKLYEYSKSDGNQKLNLKKV